MGNWSIGRTSGRDWSGQIGDGHPAYGEIGTDGDAGGTRPEPPTELKEKNEDSSCPGVTRARIRQIQEQALPNPCSRQGAIADLMSTTKSSYTKIL